MNRDRCLLRHEIIHQPDLHSLALLHDYHVPRIPPLATNGLESPNLRRRPAGLGLDPIDHVQGAFGARLLLRALQPVLGQGLVAAELLLDLCAQGLGRGVERARLNLAEQPVRVLAERVVDRAVLGGALDAARGRLLNVDVRLAVARVDVLLDVQRYGREADGFADEEADALQGQAGLGRVGEGLVLFSARPVSLLVLSGLRSARRAEKEDVVM